MHNVVHQDATALSTQVQYEVQYESPRAYAGPHRGRISLSLASGGNAWLRAFACPSEREKGCPSDELSTTVGARRYRMQYDCKYDARSMQRPMQRPLRRRCTGRLLMLPCGPETIMLATIAIILLVLWLLGMVSAYTIGGFIHVLLVIAIIMFLVRIIQGRRPV